MYFSSKISNFITFPLVGLDMRPFVFRGKYVIARVFLLPTPVGYTWFVPSVRAPFLFFNVGFSIQFRNVLNFIEIESEAIALKKLSNILSNFYLFLLFAIG